MSQQQALQHIVSSTQRFLSTFPLTCTRSNLHEQTRPELPTLSLSNSLDGFRTTVSESALLPQVSQLVISNATNLASFYERSYQQACQRILGLPTTPRQENFISSTFRQLAHAYRHLFENDVLPRFLAEALRTQFSHNPQQAKPSCPIRRRFNYEYVPLLEKYFAYDAYPTSTERLKLAQQTEMTPRQIEVWFQNHRNRSKQFGKPLHRRTPGSYCKDIQQLFEQPPLPDLSGSDPELTDEQSCTDEEKEVHRADLKNCLITSTAPPHAYPTKYPPQDVSDPFPKKDGRFCFPRPVWRRCKHSQNCNRITTHVDIEELIAQFSSKLHLRETPIRQRATRERATRARVPPTVIRPYPAPLPALVRNRLHTKPSERLPPTLIPTPFQSTSAMVKKRLAFPTRLPTWRLPTNEANATMLSFYTANTGRAAVLGSRHSSSSSLSSMPATPPLTPSDGPQILDFLDFDSPPFLADLYSETISTSLDKEPHSISLYPMSTSPLSSHLADM